MTSRQRLTQFGIDSHHGTAGLLQELADMECFPGWDEYFSHPASLSMPLGNPSPEEEVKNNTATPYDSKDLTSIQRQIPAGLAPYGSEIHLISHTLEY